MIKYTAPLKFQFFPTFTKHTFVHIVALLGIVLYPPTWPLFTLALIGIFLTGCLGITVAYHRGLTHRAFEFRYKWLERIFITLGVMALENGPIWWIGIHRIHHAYSDTLQDPHNSRPGFWYPHYLWLFHLDQRWKYPNKLENFEEYAKDIASDPYYRWLDKYFYIPPLMALIPLYLCGGWAWVLWGGFIRTVLLLHITYLVNSASHWWGYRSFKTTEGDYSRNNWWVALLTFGEGWHNNHHAFPNSSKHGFFKWWEFDLTYLLILGLERMGLITQVERINEKQILKATLPQTVPSKS